MSDNLVKKYYVAGNEMDYVSNEAFDTREEALEYIKKFLEDNKGKYPKYEMDSKGALIEKKGFFGTAKSNLRVFEVELDLEKEYSHYLFTITLTADHEWAGSYPLTEVYVKDLKFIEGFESKEEADAKREELEEEEDYMYYTVDVFCVVEAIQKEKEFEPQENEEIKKDILETMQFEFVRNGTTADQTPEKNTIWVDVGNKMEKGILDHHGEEKDGSVCATEMIYKNPELVLQNITDANNLTIVGHILPDFDCVASAYLVKQLAENEKFRPEIEKLVEYAKLTDTGRINPGRKDIKNPYSILNAFAYMPENAGVSFDKLNENIMRNGFKLIDYCLEKIKQNPEMTFESEDLISEHGEYEDILKLLEEASNQYETVLETSEKMEITVPTLDKISKNVPAVFVKEIPENELTRDMMKNWLRNDGYVFTSIPVYDSHKFITDKGEVKEDVKTSRVILSVAPENNVNLEGLGKMIEDKENKKCQNLGITRYSKDREGNISYTNRPGYESPDPWYDGRGHNYEIVDGPMSGSVLTVDEINDIALEYSKHNEKAATLVKSVKESKELSSEIASLENSQEQNK